jgi:hypothetical protein
VIATLAVLIALPTVSQGPLAREIDPLSNSSNPPLFLPAVDYDSGGYEPFAVAAGDVNGDGKPDLIVANSWACPYPFCSSGSVGVLLGNGDGTFRPPVTYGSGGRGTGSVAVADVTGDSQLDVVVANYWANDSDLSRGTVSVLRGNGDGTFEEPTSYYSGGYGASSVAVADVDGDGDPDVVVANRTGGVGVLLGNGNGTFRTAAMYSNGPEYGYSVAVADVNADSKPDLIVGSQCRVSPYTCTNLVGVLLGNGDGTFQTVITYDSGRGYGSSVTPGDVNGDGRPDLLAANLGWGSETIGVLLGIGDGSFQPVVTYPVTGHNVQAVDAADVNGDGTPDLVVAIEFAETGHGGSVGVLLGMGDGTFESVRTYASGGIEPFSVAAVDVNGDGRPDVVTSLCTVDQPCGSLVNGAIGVLLNNQPLCTNPPAITVAANPSFLWPPNGLLVPVTISGTIIEPSVGCTVRSAAYSVTDEYGEPQPGGPVNLDPGGAYSLTVLLEASRSGADIDGRVYTVTVIAENRVGKTGWQVGTVIVPHDRGR